MSDIAPELGTSAAEQGMRWLLGALERRDTLTVDDLRVAFDTSEWDERWTIEAEYEELREDARVVVPFEVVSVSITGPAECSAELAGLDGKRWAATCWVQTDPPHKLTGVRVVPAPPEGTVVRDARPDDGPALAELERRSPLRLGDVRVMFDRGQDYFASARLMEDVTIYVAEVDGMLAGVYWGARQPVRIGGVERRVFLEHHVRIDPTTRRGGVFWALVNYGRDRYARNTDSIAFWVSPENHAIRKFVENVPSWSVPALRALIPCRPTRPPDDASLEVGDWAARHDAEVVAAVLNDCHGASELFVPYTTGSLSARLARDPSQYGWDRVRIAGRAVVAVGADRLDVTNERDGHTTRNRRATVLDHGFAPGGADDYRALLRWWAGRLGGEGFTHLAVFTSPGSPTYDVVRELADQIEPFELWTFSIDEPSGVTERGLYVDPVYF